MSLGFIKFRGLAAPATPPLSKGTPSITINGSGGGQKFFAVASSKQTDKSDIVFDNVISFLEKN